MAVAGSVRGISPARWWLLSRAMSWVAVAIFALALALAVTTGATSGGHVRTDLLMVLEVAFFTTFVVRALVATQAWPSRRAPFLALAAGLMLWSLGGVILNASDADVTVFPAPGEGLFLAAYLCWTVYLVLDVPGEHHYRSVAWLDAVIVCGAAASVSAAVMISPVAAALPGSRSAIAQALALLYPLLDLSLALLVVGQILLQVRPGTWRSWAFVVGFVVMAAADLSFLLNLDMGTYDFSPVPLALWALALMILVDAACIPRPLVSARARPVPPVLLFVAAAAALLLLVFPGRDPAWWVMLPAAATLLATGGRLLVALRESRDAAEAIALAQTDDLTGLPNRRAVLHRLATRLEGDGPLGLLLLDLDGFKDVNDTLGHHAGDQVLSLAALRLREAVPPDAMLARIGGDEFALVVDEDDQTRLLARASGLRAALEEAIVVEGVELVIQASVGVTVRGAPDYRAADLLRRADVAMYEAKVHRSGAQLYDPARDDFTRARLRMGEELRRGIDEGRVTPWYQPQVDTVIGELVGIEALARWDHPEQGHIPPETFLPVARRAGLMPLLTEQMIGQVVDDAAAWWAKGCHARVSLNLSPPELLSGRTLPLLLERIRQAGLPPGTFVMEVTEDSFLADPDRARAVLVEAHAHGVLTSIDDYGTGFSSLAYLRELPLSELKIDRTFVAAVRTDERSRVIIASTVALAHALGMRVVAEGVEQEDVVADLVDTGVDVLQGYHVARPMPRADFEQWWRARQATTT
jgi:diguanylate cyclase (GGDEF)-like protein